jgi:hypothetical protein
MWTDLSHRNTIDRPGRDHERDISLDRSQPVELVPHGKLYELVECVDFSLSHLEPSLALSAARLRSVCTTVRIKPPFELLHGSPFLAPQCEHGTLYAPMMAMVNYVHLLWTHRINGSQSRSKNVPSFSR